VIFGIGKIFLKIKNDQLVGGEVKGELNYLDFIIENQILR